MKIRIVDDAKKHFKRLSVRFLIALMTIQPVWAALDSSIKDGVPDVIKNTINSILLMGALAGAFIKQDILTQPKDENQDGV